MAEALHLPLATMATLLAYLAGRRLHALLRSPLTTPVFVATALVAATLSIGQVPYEAYLAGSSLWIELLGPATAALAIPLYKHRQTVRAFLLPALGGVVCGALSTLAAAIGLAVLFRLPDLVTASIGFKSVTSPIAAELAPLIHGDPTLAVTFVIATSIFGAMAGPWLLDRLGVRSGLARGLAYGTVSTGIGTAQAISEGELPGAAAATAMALAGVLVAFLAPHVMPFLLHSWQLALL